MITIRDGLPTAAELRAIGFDYWRRWRADDPTASSPAEPDEELLALAGEPFGSVEDAYDRLVRIERHLRERDDRRSVFLTVYAAMTVTVRDGIRSGFFADPDWVAAYLVTFAEHYRRALYAFERRETEVVPPPWRIGFEASIGGDTLVYQDALLGINAHINYDLTYALHEVAIDPDRGSKLADHERINCVLERLTDLVQETLVEVYAARGVSRIDELLGTLDERLALSGLTRSRSLAWRNAVLLADLPTGVIRKYVDWRVRAISTGMAHLVLESRLDRSTHRRLRNIEARNVSLTHFHDAFLERVPAGVPDG